MSRRIEMVHVMRALDSVLGAPTVTSNQGAALAEFLNGQVAVEPRPVTWRMVEPWYTKHEQALKDVARFEGVKGVTLEVWRGATLELREELATLDEVVGVLKKGASKRTSAKRRYTEKLTAKHDREVSRLVALIRDIDQALDARLDQASLGHDIECRVAAVLRDAKS
jgi:hypothetical protein